MGWLFEFQSWPSVALVVLLSAEIVRSTAENLEAFDASSFLNLQLEASPVKNERSKRDEGPSEAGQKLSRVIITPQGVKTNFTSNRPKWLQMNVGAVGIANIEEMKKLANYPYWKSKLPPQQAPAQVSGRGFISDGLAKLAKDTKKKMTAFKNKVNSVLQSHKQPKLLEILLGSDALDKKNHEGIKQIPKKIFESLVVKKTEKDSSETVSDRDKPHKDKDDKTDEKSAGADQEKSETNDEASSETTETTEKGYLEDLTGGLFGGLFG